MTIFRCEMRLLIAVAASLALASCGRPDVKACEQFIKSGLMAPSTDERLSLSSRDEKVTWEQHLKEKPFDRNDDLIHRGYELGVSRRIVAVEYQAANAFGVPIRSAEQCAFRLSDGKLPDSNSLMSSEKMAEANDTLRRLNETGALAPGQHLNFPKPAYSCCE